MACHRWYGVRGVTAEEDVIAGCIAAIQALQMHSAAQLSMNHYLILFYIFLHDGITRKELTEQLPNVSKEMVQRYVKDLLIEHKLLTETEAETDTRYKNLHLNDNGHQIILTVVQKMQDCASCLKIDSNLNLSADNGI